MTPTLRLLTSALVIFGALAAVAGVSSALFSDSATLENSTFATGEGADLLIAPEGPESPGTYADSILGPTITNMLPGDTETFTFWLKNNSDSETLSLDLSTIIENVNSLPVDSTLRDDLSVGFTCDVGDDDSTTPDGPGITPKTLNDWDNDVSAMTGLGTLGPNDGTVNGIGSDEAECIMTATLSSSSTAENNSVNFDAEFTGTQATPTTTPPPE